MILNQLVTCLLYTSLAKDKNPSEEKIRDHLSGNLCRCTGYNKIIDAVKLSNKYMKEGK